MSTKIHNGMQATDRNPFTAHKRIKKVLEPIFLDKFDRALEKAVSETGKTWDEVFQTLWPRESEAKKHWRESIPESKSRAAERLYELIVELYNSPTHTFTDIDFGYEVILLPNGLGATQPPLVLVFSEKGGDQYRKALFDAGVTEDFGYWNNSEQPNGVTDEDWDKREKAWSKLDVPSEDGLRFGMPSKFETVWGRE